MNQTLFQITIVIDDYDKAINYYTTVLGFYLLEDTTLENGKRWVRVSPSNDKGISLLLAKAKNKEQESRIGNQTGGRVFLFLHTDNALKDYATYTSRQVKVIRKPSTEPYGIVFVFQDIYGNLWDVIQPLQLNKH